MINIHKDNSLKHGFIFRYLKRKKSNPFLTFKVIHPECLEWN